MGRAYESSLACCLPRGCEAEQSAKVFLAEILVAEAEIEELVGTMSGTTVVALAE